MSSSLSESFALPRRGVLSLVGAGGKTSLALRLAQELAKQDRRVLFTTTTKIFPPKSHQIPQRIVATDPAEVIRQAGKLLPTARLMAAGARYATTSGKWEGFSPEAVDLFAQSDLWDWVIVEADGASRRPIKAQAEHEPVVPASTTHYVVMTGLDAIGRTLSGDTVHRPEIFSRLTGMQPGETITPSSVAALLAHADGPFAHCPENAFACAAFNKADGENALQAGQETVIALCALAPERINRIAMLAVQAATPVVFTLDLEESRA